MATTLKYMKMARGCKELFERVDAEYRKEFPSVGNSRVTNSVLFGYAYDKIAGLIHVINWAEVSRSWAFSPDSNCPDVRFTSSLSLPTSLYPRATWDALEEFRAYCKEIFSGIRRNVYLPFCVRLILAAFILSVKGELPFMVAGGDKLPADAPAAFDPSIFEDVPACMVASESERIDNRRALNYEGIGSDLWPNGAVDAEGFADSELF